MVTITVVASAVVLLLVVVLVARSAPPRSASFVRPVPARPPVAPTSLPKKVLSLNETMLPATTMASGGTSALDTGTHLDASGVAARLLDPPQAAAVDPTSIRDAIHRSGTDHGGIVWETTVVELRDEAAAQALVDQARTSTVLGAPVATPDLGHAAGFERRTSDKIVPTVVLPFRNLVVVSSVTLPVDSPLLAHARQSTDVVIALATLEYKQFDCTYGGSGLSNNVVPHGC